MAAEAPSPALLTVADSVNDSPVSGVLSVTESDPTTKSVSGITVTDIDTDEQLFVVLDSPATASTHAL